MAEVDKIQSFVFCSSRLREVVGASYLLEQFGEKIEKDYQAKEGVDRVLSSKGGSFRIIVDEEKAEALKKDLRQRFEQEVGGSITITSVEYNYHDTVIKEGNRALRQAKLIGDDPEPLWHSPYHAICSSSGEELAIAYQKPIDFQDEQERYLGKLTLEKAKVDAKIAISRQLRDSLISIKGSGTITVHKEATEPSTYAWDNRQYIAYLVADGNRMGEYFNQCKADELKQLSSEIGQITLKAFAKSIENLLERSEDIPDYKGFTKDTLPVLPLISGGDDLFVLMPAPWALDIAIQFCKHYEEAMTTYLNTNISYFQENNRKATTGVAVVICKVKYPYRTAYKYANNLLGDAKSHAKKDGQSSLIIDFVLGSDSVERNSRTEPKPYTYEQAQYFINHRLNLRNIPSNKLHKIRNKGDVDAITRRVEQLYEENIATTLKKALEDANRNQDSLNELIKLWDFCYDSSKKQDEYLTENR